MGVTRWWVTLGVIAATTTTAVAAEEDNGIYLPNTGVYVRLDPTSWKAVRVDPGTDVLSVGSTKVAVSGSDVPCAQHWGSRATAPRPDWVPATFGPVAIADARAIEVCTDRPGGGVVVRLDATIDHQTALVALEALAAARETTANDKLRFRAGFELDAIPTARLQFRAGHFVDYTADVLHVTAPQAVEIAIIEFPSTCAESFRSTPMMGWEVKPEQPAWLPPGYDNRLARSGARVAACLQRPSDSVLLSVSEDTRPGHDNVDATRAILTAIAAAVNGAESPVTPVPTKLARLQRTAPIDPRWTSSDDGVLTWTGSTPPLRVDAELRPGDKCVAQRFNMNVVGTPGWAPKGFFYPALKINPGNTTRYAVCAETFAGAIEVQIEHVEAAPWAVTALLAAILAAPTEKPATTPADEAAQRASMARFYGVPAPSSRLGLDVFLRIRHVDPAGGIPNYNTSLETGATTGLGVGIHTRKVKPWTQFKQVALDLYGNAGKAPTYGWGYDARASLGLQLGAYDTHFFPVIGGGIDGFTKSDTFETPSAPYWFWGFGIHVNFWGKGTWFWEFTRHYRSDSVWNVEARIRSGVGVTARWMIDMELVTWGQIFSDNTQLSVLSVGAGYRL